jgi:hypothetical protein
LSFLRAPVAPIFSLLLLVFLLNGSEKALQRFSLG